MRSKFIVDERLILVFKKIRNYRKISGSLLVVRIGVFNKRLIVKTKKDINDR